ncbi:thiolase family protein [Agrococcus jejuensis]|uniref:Acetyl-CoA acetyltransferase n=1 Tax=Agrococcus jejuensis TaxID=399736 RepID=A0A1G8A0D9_9MICO|nr:thiolase family protein [Agrococcus jejuensis]SDH14379.1 Acetyl-CoA acetyltransferase [Agrococcus jejuensis]
MVGTGVHIGGVGMTRFGVHEGETPASLAGQAIRDALADAGLGSDRVEVAFVGSTTGSALHGQHMIGGEIVLREAGIGAIPAFNVENACATGTSAFHLATAHVRAGLADVALAVGVEQMHVGDRARTMQVFDGAYDVKHPELLQQTLRELGGDVDLDGLGDRSVFMDIYAALARAYMAETGLTARQIAAVSAKNHVHSVDNERSHFRKPFTVDEVLAARPLAPPLTVPMCSPVTDGAAAALVVSAEVAATLPAPIRVLATVVGTGTDRELGDWDAHITRRVSARAFEEAGVGPDAVDVAELHDATAFAEVLQAEMIGLFERGAGGAAAEAGESSIGGRLPINTSGGLESKGHPLAATGLGQLFELTEQLRGRAGSRQVEGARIALAENGGGFHKGEDAVTAITILGA